MNGEELYQVYVSHMLNVWGTEVDQWEDLAESDQSAWNAVADYAKPEES